MQVYAQGACGCVVWHVLYFTYCTFYRNVVSVSVSRRTNVSSRSRLGQNAQRLGLVSVSELCVSGLDHGKKDLGVSSLVSDHFVSSKRFVQVGGHWGNTSQ